MNGLKEGIESNCLEHDRDMQDLQISTGSRVWRLHFLQSGTRAPVAHAVRHAQTRKLCESAGYARRQGRICSCEGEGRYSLMPYSFILYCSARRLMPNNLAACSRWLVTSASVRRMVSRSMSFNDEPKATTIVCASSLLA